MKRANARYRVGADSAGATVGQPSGHRFPLDLHKRPGFPDPHSHRYFAQRLRRQRRKWRVLVRTQQTVTNPDTAASKFPGFEQTNVWMFCDTERCGIHAANLNPSVSDFQRWKAGFRQFVKVRMIA